jgi:hypothetical protein
MDSGNVFDSSSSDDDEEAAYNDEILAVILAMINLNEGTTEERNFKWQTQRLLWEDHVAKLRHSNEFTKTYRMTYDTFQKLLEILRSKITVDYMLSRNSVPGTDPIYPELVMHLAIRWLAGGMFGDIRDASGVSTPSIYRLLYRFLDAVLTAEELRIKFPTEPDEIDAAASAFESKSTHGVMNGCVGALDGLLVHISQPKGKEVKNIRSYYSGHYCCFGMNVQAVCDHRLRFIYLCVAGPGRMPDISAYRKSELRKLVEALPPTKYIVADNAYVPTEHLLTPFSGADRKDEGNDIFNFYLSQLRIRIEMAFGLLTTKWRVFRRPMDIRIENVSKVVEACARLHNFIITNDTSEEFADNMIDPFPVPDNSRVTLPVGLGYMPTMSDVLVEDNQPIAMGGTSFLRQTIRQHIVDNGYQRPTDNIIRNLGNNNEE